MTQENEQNNHCTFQREWNEWAEEQFNEDKITEASENISDLLARIKQRERGSPFTFFKTDKRGFKHDQEKMPNVRKIQCTDQTLENRGSSTTIYVDMPEMSR